MNATGTEVMDQARGVKRTADDCFDDDQRFAKRFHLLNIGAQHVSSTTSRQGPDPDPAARATANDKLYIPVSTRPQLQGFAQPDDEHMNIDDTKDRVYIHNLDDELADIEPDEEKLVFLPDIEKKINAIPRHVLTGNRTESQQLVLYNLPPSLSVPLDQDNVRKAILEARQRAREQATQVSSNADGAPPEEQPETAHGYDSPDYSVDDDFDDPDAMDIG